MEKFKKDIEIFEVMGKRLENIKQSLDKMGKSLERGAQRRGLSICIQDYLAAGLVVTGAAGYSDYLLNDILGYGANDTRSCFIETLMIGTGILFAYRVAKGFDKYLLYKKEKKME